MTDLTARPELGDRLTENTGIWRLFDLNGRTLYIDLDESVSYAPEPCTHGASSDRWESFRYRPEVRIGLPVFFVRPDRWERTTVIRSFEAVPEGADVEVQMLPALRA